MLRNFFNPNKDAKIQAKKDLKGEPKGTQGDLTPNFPIFAKPILNLDFYMNVDPGSTYRCQIFRKLM